MLKLPLDTLVGQAQPNVPATIQQLVSDVHMGTISPVLGGDPHVPRYLVTEGTSDLFNIDVHTTIENKLHIFTDMRPFITDKRSIRRLGYRDFVIRDIHSQLLSLYASEKHSDLFLTDLSFAGNVFVEAVSMRLVHIYRLDGEQQLIVRMILAQWFGMRVRNIAGEYSVQQMTRDVKVYTGVDPTRLSQRLLDLGRIDTIATLEDLVNTIRERLASAKVANMTLTTVLILMKSLAFIYKGEVLIPLALEYPVTFITLTHMALTDKSMRKSYLFTAASNAQRQAKKEAETFLTSMTRVTIPPQLSNE